MILRNRRQGVVRGGGRGNGLELDYVPLQADVRPGDRVLTAGIDGVYPRGIPIGTVALGRARGWQQLFHRIEVVPGGRLRCRRPGLPAGVPGGAAAADPGEAPRCKALSSSPPSRSPPSPTSSGCGCGPNFARAVDIFLVVAALYGLRGNSLSGLLVGLVVGLLQDTLTSGLFGLFGFADTINRLYRGPPGAAAGHPAPVGGLRAGQLRLRAPAGDHPGDRLPAAPRRAAVQPAVGGGPRGGVRGPRDGPLHRGRALAQLLGGPPPRADMSKLRLD